MSNRRRKRTYFEESAYFNKETYNYYRDRLIELAISAFEWLNLPDSIDSRFLEMELLKLGWVLFFKEEDLAGTVRGKAPYFVMDCAIGGQLDIYRVPITRRAYAVNGFSRNFTNQDSVIIYNNMLRRNTYPTLKMYARRLAVLDRIIDVNANAQKTPVLVKGSEEQKLTLLNVYKEWDGNSPVIFGDKGLANDILTVLRTDAPFIADKIYDLKSQYWNEALTFLGISNINTVKKERMITDEVTRNLGGTVFSRYSRLHERKEACKQINAMFGLNIDVTYREDFQEVSDGEPDDDDRLEGMEGGNKYE